jgi:hypothetical protein
VLVFGNTTGQSNPKFKIPRQSPSLMVHYVGNFAPPQPQQPYYVPPFPAKRQTSSISSQASTVQSLSFNADPNPQVSLPLVFETETLETSYVSYTESHTSSKRKFDEVIYLDDYQNQFEDENDYEQSQGESWLIGDKIIQKIPLIDGREGYTVDGYIAPRLPIGETGRTELKAALAAILPRNSELRKQTNKFAALKSASVDQLLALAVALGVWDKAEGISSWYTSTRDPATDKRPLTVYKPKRQ